ncbi:S8 family peptidase [Flavobacterium sp. xlx-214]|uniref:S8/S53 family peptidase n=1 Tax=unclassified Flavobacterium TaxID=196869 RepID=UPI0013CF5E30|nr:MULTISPECIES: S8/S53 family peptidase [unclassified Flavobacterium]MBA5793406.1 S8 family peptidase [Flavobacterium sp. xlx-221]QMI84034.1 S8 family peptidase [Flavobacterium sp. xlx-214]
MKNKITKLFLALALASFSANAQVDSNSASVSNTMPDYVRKGTNVEFLKSFAAENEAEYDKNYTKAVEIAKKQGKPISGEENGSSFALAGYDEETEALIYKTTSNSKATSGYEFFNNVLVGSSVQTANAKPLHARGIEGAGMIAGVWDGGAGLTGHLGFTTGRYLHKNSPNVGASQGGIAHSAHVAGTVASGEFGNNYAKGFAYKAIVHAYNGINANDIPTMTAAATAQTNTIYVSNHSYGLDAPKYIASGGTTAIFGQYNARAREYDVLANNAAYYTMVFAAGNDRSDGSVPAKTGRKDLLSNSGVSKNVVVVAATRGTENYSGITGPTSVGSVAGVGPFISTYSNYGPTDDFRIKPDIAAKGGEYGFDPVVSVGVGGITSTDVMAGTSMAAPAVTGVFTLWQGYHKKVFDRYMKSAAVRALMAHTARETGPAAGPDFMFGWGLIDAAKGVDIIDQAVAKTAIFQDLKIIQGSTFNYKFVYDGNGPLVVTIAWNDPAGTVSSLSDVDLKKLVNDLDVRLVNTDTNATSFPWSLNRDIKIAPSSINIATRLVDNERDNIEKIEPQNAVAGNYEVVITHKGTLQGGEQDFTLVVSGAGGQMPTIGNGLSLEDNVLKNLNVYPNPADSNLNISGDLDKLTNTKAYIYDMSGKKIKDVSLNLNSKDASIDVSFLKTGSYILVLAKDAVQQSYKFVKK